MITVPLATPTRMSADEKSCVERAVTRVLESSRWILGEEVAGFEKEFARYVDAVEAVGVGNGTDALTLAFLALEIPAGSDILVCETDGGYSAVAARAAGLNPVPMDVDTETLSPSVETAMRVMTEGTRAIVVTHLHGNALDLTAFDAWRKQAKLFLIEDCSQAHGLRVNGKHVGTTGDVATFSFYPTKNLGAVGDAGAIVFSDSSPFGAAARARELREYGWRERYRPALPGGRNTRMDEIQAAVLRERLPFLDARNAARRLVWQRYGETLTASGRATLLGTGGASVAHHAVVMTRSYADREALAEHLTGSGIETGIHYPWLVSEMFSDQRPSITRGSEQTASSLKRDRMLSIPCSPELAEVEIARVDQGLSDWSKT
jgi:dTDP-4-amino-4,6-dideoxygalactose transaminase